jgi:hypothetical protein
METQHTTLTQAQRDILRLLARPLPESEWKRIRTMLAEHFADRAMDAMDAVWDERGWNDADVDRMLHAHERVGRTAPDVL